MLPQTSLTAIATSVTAMGFFKEILCFPACCCSIEITFKTSPKYITVSNSTGLDIQVLVHDTRGVRTIVHTASAWMAGFGSESIKASYHTPQGLNEPSMVRSATCDSRHGVSYSLLE